METDNPAPANEPRPPDHPPPNNLPPTHHPEPASDLDELRDVLQRLKLVLDGTINPPDSLTTPDLTPELRLAWSEIVSKFKEVDEALASGAHTTRLQEVGLTGPSWKVKLAGFRRAFSRMWRAGKEKLREHTQSVLRWGDVILGSLATILSAAEIIKEFKECVETDLAEQAEVRPPEQQDKLT